MYIYIYIYIYIHIYIHIYIYICIYIYQPEPCWEDKITNTIAGFSTSACTTTHEYLAASPSPDLRLDLQQTAACAYCHTLQHTATHCNTLQHTAKHCNT